MKAVLFKHMYTFKNNGLYFVKGQGFVVADVSDASLLTYDEVKALRAVGFDGQSALVQKSYAVCYVREGDINGNTVDFNERNPSKHRFPTEAIAHEHARIWVAKESHKGYFVIETNDPVTRTTPARD